MFKPSPLKSKGFHPFGDLIGFEFTELRKGYSQCVLNISKKHFNPHMTVHGGVMYSMADTGMGGALYSLLEKGESCATVEIKIIYIKPVKEGTLICNTKVIHKGRSFGVLESEILNDEILVSKAYGTFSIFKINTRKKCIVIENYKAHYNIPLVFKKGEKVSIGQKESEWSGWVWCTNKDEESRWVPENYLEISGKMVEIKRDYNAKELSIEVGEGLTIEEEEAEWFWVTNQQGESGWVPIKNVNIL
ncbi:MAG: hotdog fold thioesterase [Candidatus Lokiarchaeia archaeon]|nr:hotdog fold thioesterase [Candidatus Lokiarchaeia archaeon]